MTSDTCQCQQILLTIKNIYLIGCNTQSKHFFPFINFTNTT